MPLFYKREQANACCPRLRGALRQRWRQSEVYPLPALSMEATKSPRPSTSLLFLRRIPSRGADVVHGNQKEKEKVVKHATLKIPLKSMRIWLLAMLRAAAGMSCSPELHLTSYIFFPPSFSWVHPTVCKCNFIREKTTAAQLQNLSQACIPSSSLKVIFSTIVTLPIYILVKAMWHLHRRKQAG